MGIQVARLAGVPKTGLERAKEILGNLEESELTPEGNVRQSSRRHHDREKLKHSLRRHKWTYSVSAAEIPGGLQ